MWAGSTLGLPSPLFGPVSLERRGHRWRGLPQLSSCIRVKRGDDGLTAMENQLGTETLPFFGRRFISLDLLTSHAKESSQMNRSNATAGTAAVALSLVN